MSFPALAVRAMGTTGAMPFLENADSHWAAISGWQGDSGDLGDTGQFDDGDEAPSGGDGSDEDDREV